ncbi:hypothetical protein JYU34_013778 [Plutella xylostella]|uniref:Mediator of DNA damage checkpoint protein 1 n=1 Tax=Plutella xylostella TaxID=51655 RepID=A0ABQ7QBJ7_PLUXY|nr:hypothetical protein JYU34_013778 [Plutella xylostella]
MECTQRLECTQDLNPESYSQRTGPDQVGFLGICGQTYPIHVGPNKVGRDPQTCSIVLDMNSLSRQHAVINVLASSSKKEYMLMDLGSVNKTKLGLKTLQPYIPYTLQNGDTIQFGDVFGIFRLFEEDTDLPMTQDIGIPDTPVFSRQMSKLGHSAMTTVPESPDVSDKDDSFIGSSQQPKDPEFKSPRNNFIKPSAKTVLRPSIGTNKINNIFWTSSQKSPSLKLNLDDSSDSLNESSSSASTIKTVTTNDAKDVHEMDTQVPYATNDLNESTDSIYTANTQLPQSNSQSIHNLNTQLPSNENLPVVNKITEQHNIELELSVANNKDKESIFDAKTQLFVPDDIHNAETQVTVTGKDKSIDKGRQSLNVRKDDEYEIHDAKTQIFTEQPQLSNNNEEADRISQKTISESDEEILNDEFVNDDFEMKNEENVRKGLHVPKEKEPVCKANESDDEILFDDLDGRDVMYDNLSQPLLGPEVSPSKLSDKENIEVQLNDSQSTCSPIIGRKRNVKRLDSDNSTDCEDLLLPVQKKTSKPVIDEDETDCEDNIAVDRNEINEDIAILPTQQIVIQNNNPDDDETDCEEDIFNDDPIIIKNKSPKADNKPLEFEDMATQLLEEDTTPNSKTNTSIEDMQTQMIDEPTDKQPTIADGDCLEDMATQVITVENENKADVAKDDASPFKIPFMSPIKVKRKDILKLAPRSVTPRPALNQPTSKNNEKDSEEAYYAATQDILDDLCTQKICEDDDEIVPCSVEDFEVGDPFRHIDADLTPKKKLLVADKSFGSSDTKEKIGNYVSSLSNSQIKEVVGVKDVSVSELTKKSSSDMSDLEVTPKKVRPIKFMNVELPDSQEIKTSVHRSANCATTESSSESEQEAESQENTPILFKKKKRLKKNDAKVDLKTKFQLEALPTRCLTRVRRPPIKLEDQAKTLSETILKPKYLTEQEDDIDKEILTENLTRLKNDKKKATDKEKRNDDKDTVPSVQKESTIKKEQSENKSKDKAKEDDLTVNTRNKSKRKSDEQKENANKKPSTKSKKNVARDDHDKVNVIDTKESKRSVRNSSKTKKESNEIHNKASTSSGMRSPRDIEIKMSNDNEKIGIKEIKSTVSSPTKQKTIATRKSQGQDNIKNTESTSKTNSTHNNKTLKSKEIETLINSATDEIVKQEPAPTTRGRGRPRKEKQSKSPEKQKEKEKPKTSRGRKKSPSPPTETSSVRRSKRQRTPKDKGDSQSDSQTEKPSKEKKERKTKSANKDVKPEPLLKSILKTRNSNHEMSTVYNMSTESTSADTPKGLKRPSTETREPSPKRSRSSAAQNAAPNKAVEKQFVLFTAFPNEEVKSKLVKLGAVLVSDVSACTVLVTLQVKRTFKLLCVVGLGKPIVGPAWVQACVDSNTIVDPWQHILRDEAAEKRFHFDLHRTLTGPRAFLRGCSVSATPGVLPSAPEMKLIVESSGGTWKEGGKNWLCVSHPNDKALWPSLKRRGATLVSTELILGGVLRQKLDIEQNRLQVRVSIVNN